MSPSSKRYLGMGIIAAIVVGVVLVVLRSERPRDLVLQIEPITQTTDVTVFVGGAVAEPGLYTLPRGSRVAHAIDLAGMLPEADIAAIDMAREIRDEQSITVPFQVPASEATPLPTPRQGQAGTVPVDAAPPPINVNTASSSELQRLPGIGPALAERIVVYREENGPFGTLDDLAQVSGISSRMVEEFRDLATTES